MKKYRISAPRDGAVNGTIHIPTSKSLCNRFLIMNALANNTKPVERLSEADDTKMLLAGLNQASEQKFNTGIGGTTYRFLLAYLASQPNVDIILEASGRMQQRPIGLLVQALNKIGADIRYLGKIGYPPVHIKGKALQGDRVKMNGEVSSQFLSAVAMIAPYTNEGVELLIQGETVSRRYFEMTLKLLEEFGIEVEDNEHIVNISKGEYNLPEAIVPEPDWSSASYWYSIATLSQNFDVKLTDLKRGSVQPDSATARIFKSFGVGTIFTDEGAEVVSEVAEPKLSHHRFELLYNPDLAQTLAVTLAGIRQCATLDGLQTLRDKETNRMEALKTEMAKLNVEVEIINDHKLFMDPQGALPETAEIATYGDHRMAMAFAPLALKMKHITIQNPDVVSKSYPGFWKDLKKVGFRVEEV